MSNKNKKNNNPMKSLGLVDDEPKLPEWGKKIPFDRYLATDMISSHAVMDFNKSPKLWKRKKDGLIPDIIKDVLSFGTAFHCFVLRGSG